MASNFQQGVRDRHRHVVVSQPAGADGHGDREIVLRHRHQDVPRPGRGGNRVVAQNRPTRTRAPDRAPRTESNKYRIASRHRAYVR